MSRAHTRHRLDRAFAGRQTTTDGGGGDARGRERTNLANILMTFVFGACYVHPHYCMRHICHLSSARRRAGLLLRDCFLDDFGRGGFFLPCEALPAEGHTLA